MKELKSMVKGMELGVYVYRRTLDAYQEHPEKLARQCSEMGITEVYLSFSAKSALKDKKYKKRLRSFIKAFHVRKIIVLASFLDHKTIMGVRPLELSLEGFSAFNKSGSKKTRFDGICADVEPHIIKKGRDIPADFHLRWDGKSGYGIGKDNDLLVQKTIAILADVKKTCPEILFAQSIPHFFHHHAAKGDMKKGQVADFLEPCDFVLLMAYSNKADKILKYAEDELKDNKKKRSVMVVIKTSIKTKGGGGDTTSLHAAGWSSMMKTIKTIKRKTAKHKTFRGISFFEYEGLEIMLLKKQ